MDAPPRGRRAWTGQLLVFEAAAGRRQNTLDHVRPPEASFRETRNDENCNVSCFSMRTTVNSIEVMS